MSTQEEQELSPEELTKIDEKLRFQMELEFVQLLANPAYLNFLAQHRYFEDPAFLNYLKYLQYWKDPKYSKYIVYPHALYFLDRLEDEKFRDECKKKEACDFLARQQGLHWQFYRRNRVIAASKEILEEKKIE